jgi:DNA-binding MarR family transcriptional regulator
LTGLSENNRRAKYYALTTKGRKQLRAETSAWSVFPGAVGKVLTSTDHPGPCDLARRPESSVARLAHEIASLCEGFPSIAIVIYTRLLPEVVPHLVRLAQLNLTDIVFAGYDDTRNRVASKRVSDQSSEFRFVSGRLRTPARRAGRRTGLQLLGFNSPCLLVANGRIGRSLAMLPDKGRTVREVADDLDIRDRSLAENVMTLTGMTLREAPRGVDTSGIAEAPVHRLRTAPVDPIDPIDEAFPGCARRTPSNL